MSDFRTVAVKKRGISSRVAPVSVGMDCETAPRLLSPHFKGAGSWGYPWSVGVTPAFQLCPARMHARPDSAERCSGSGTVGSGTWFGLLQSNHVSA